LLKHQPLWGDPGPFHAFLDRFRRENPDVLLRTETLPNASDVAREMFVTALEDFPAHANPEVLGDNDIIAKPFLLIEMTLKAVTHIEWARLQK